MQREDLSEKTALVTGGSRGIGLHIARALLNAGARVLITGRTERTLKSAVEDLGAGAFPYVCDQRYPESVRSFARKVTEQHGPLDILVNNAGIMHYAPVATMPIAMWDEVIETNLRGVFLITQAFLPPMIERNRGDIFMISSMSGKKGDADAGAYAASKFGVQGFAQALQYEVRKNNIRVMVLNPSTVDSKPDATVREGPGCYLHAADMAATIVHLACLPRRTLIRDMDIWGLNPPGA